MNRSLKILLTNQKLKALVVADGRSQRELTHNMSLEVRKSAESFSLCSDEFYAILGKSRKASRDGASWLVKVLVLDTSALIMGLDPLGLQLDTYSVPEVAEELRVQNRSIIPFDCFIFIWQIENSIPKYESAAGGS